ncbi:MAG: hypothetical protein GKR92_02855 [Gammaproteobacteria bacterium]|nr:MAG: hypothetical protein GKR92_02855 [Gammaproteobacteria bacterium]
MEPKINYVGLLILIILGVAVGNFASSFITTKYFHKESEKISVEVSKAVPTTPSKATETSKLETARETVKLSPEAQPGLHIEPEAIENSADHKQLIEKRKIDENGVRLAKTCSEWTTAHKDMQTQTSERGMNKHCAEYYDYLSFGNLPNSN